jgi:hypothetical protein
MITHSMKIRQQLHSARTSALSEQERRQELREAEDRAARDRGDEQPEPQASPRASDT